MFMQTAIQYLLEKDPIFSSIITQYGIPDFPRRPPGFVSLVMFILEQKISLNAAKATFISLQNKVGCIEPQLLFHLCEEDYRATGISRQKTIYLKALSEAIITGVLDINNLHRQPQAKVREDLIQIKGIGNWTIDMYLLFCIEAKDILPLGDIAIKNTLTELLGIHDLNAIENYTLKWSPHRSAATFLLWHYYLGKRNRKIA
jgi:DNA-3-methyladenine glycosylase II